MTESISTEDSLEGVARELAGMRNVVDENVPADTDYYVYGANPLGLIKSGENDDVIFEDLDVEEERVGIEGRNWMCNPMKRVADGGFDFVVRVDRKKKGILEPTKVSWR